MSVPTESEVRSWTAGERAEVARFLDHLVERPMGTSGVIRRRRLSIVAAAIGALVMLPWIGYLASSLPLAEFGGAWRVAWVGFDIMPAFVLMTTAWLGFRRRQVAILGLLVASTMLFTDAWFDVALWDTGTVGSDPQRRAARGPVRNPSCKQCHLDPSADILDGRTLERARGTSPTLWHQQFLVTRPPASD